VAFSPDGKLLASCANKGFWPKDRSVRLWRVEDGTLLNILEQHDGDVLKVAFSPDGTLIASGGADNVVRLWGIE
jgi:WD40 repeat protein